MVNVKAAHGDAANPSAFLLNNKNLHKVPTTVQKPTYNRDDLKHGIVHFGPGQFACAHFFEYVEDLVEGGRMDLGVTAVCPNNPERRDLLAPQDNLYTISAGSGEEREDRQDRVIGCIKDVLVASEDRKKIVNLIADPSTQIVTMTVTQKGYHFDDNHQLNLKSEDIQKSLANADEPTAVVAYLVEAMAIRMKNNQPGLTVLSCDNVVNNGTNLKGTLLAYANERSKARNNGLLDEQAKALTHWIEENVVCPNTMVDRITPKYERSQTEVLQGDHGFTDNAPIKTEPSRAFVIDSAYANVLPELDKVGAKFDDHVSLYVRAKNRMLNGAHMVMGLMGRLEGHTYAHEVMEDPKLREFVVNVMDEMIGTLEGSDDLNLEQYRDSLLVRFSNRYMGDELQRLARNGLSKLGRILDPIKELRGDLQQYPYLMTSAAAWVGYLKRADDSHEVKGDFHIEDAAAYGVKDEKGVVKDKYVEHAKMLNGHIAPFLAQANVWGSLREREGFHEAMQEGWAALGKGGLLTVKPKSPAAGPATPGLDSSPN